MNQIGLAQVFDNLTFKHMDGLRIQLQSLDNDQRIDLLNISCIWFAQIPTSGMTLDKLLLPLSASFLHYK